MKTILLALGFLTLIRSAHAEDAANTEARAHVKKAVALYDDARYEDAAVEMEAAYKILPLPELQYNLAQCYERTGRPREAAAAYRRYVAGKPGADDRAQVEERVRNLDERAKKMAEGIAAPPPPVEKVVLKTVIVYREAPPRPGRGARVAAYGLGVLALAAIGSGVTCAVLAGRDATQVQQAANPMNPMSFGGTAATESAGHTDVILAWTSFGLAAVGAAGAVALYALGNKIDNESPPPVASAPRIAPIFGTSMAGFALAGSF